MAPPPRLVLLFQFYPLLLLLLPSLHLQTALAIPRRIPSQTHRKQIQAFGGRGRNNTRQPLSSGYKEYFYSQPFDHINHELESFGTFKQKFVMNREYWAGPNSSAPMLVYFGSEGPLDVESAGFVNDHCQTLSALCLCIEHRFYGQSTPFASMADVLDNDTIRGFFNPAQALADNAEILMYVRRAMKSPYTPALLSGESYGGMLCAWFRLKFPHLASGCLASSAPMFYFDKAIPVDGYDRILTEDFRNVSENCYQTIRDSWAQIDKLASESDGLSNLSRKFQICSKLNQSSELKEFLVSMYTYAAQYNDPPTYPVSMICGGIDDASKKTNDVLALVSAGIVSYFGNKSCYDMKYFDQPSETSEGWEWLECSEIMMHIAQGGKDSLFNGSGRFQLGRNKRRCFELFNVSSRPYWLTTFYGGVDNKFYLKRFGSNIIFTNGLKDPYSNAGVLEDINDSIVALTTANGSHALDMRPAQDDDPDWLVEQRNKTVNIMQGWLDTYFSDLKQYLKE